MGRWCDFLLIWFCFCGYYITKMAWYFCRFSKFLLIVNVDSFGSFWCLFNCYVGLWLFWWSFSFVGFSFEVCFFSVGFSVFYSLCWVSFAVVAVFLFKSCLNWFHWWTGCWVGQVTSLFIYFFFNSFKNHLNFSFM